MAITKVHPVKSTLDKSIDYIIDQSKTDGKCLVSGIYCSHEIAAEQFNMTKKYFSKTGGILAFHLIQSFKPGEVDEVTAHKIGVELAKGITKDRYQAVVSTHINTGSIHNHIIYNSVSHIDGKKFYANKQSYKETREISDKLCRENSLTVLENTKGRGKSYKEWYEDRNGKSWKTQMKTEIDHAINISDSFEDFKKLIRLKDYTIKEGKYISFNHQVKIVL